MEIDNASYIRSLETWHLGSVITSGKSFLGDSFDKAVPVGRGGDAYWILHRVRNKHLPLQKFELHTKVHGEEGLRRLLKHEKETDMAHDTHLGGLELYTTAYSVAYARRYLAGEEVFDLLVPLDAHLLYVVRQCSAEDSESGRGRTAIIQWIDHIHSEDKRRIIEDADYALVALHECPNFQPNMPFLIALLSGSNAFVMGRDLPALPGYYRQCPH